VNSEFLGHHLLGFGPCYLRNNDIPVDPSTDRVRRLFDERSTPGVVGDTMCCKESFGLFEKNSGLGTPGKLRKRFRVFDGFGPRDSRRFGGRSQSIAKSAQSFTEGILLLAQFLEILRIRTLGDSVSNLQSTFGNLIFKGGVGLLASLGRSLEIG